MGAEGREVDARLARLGAWRRGRYASLAVFAGAWAAVGLQREWAGSRLAGVRTFSLITMLGTLAALGKSGSGVGAGSWRRVLWRWRGDGVGNYLVLRQEKVRDAGSRRRSRCW